MQSNIRRAFEKSLVAIPQGLGAANTAYENTTFTPKADFPHQLSRLVPLPVENPTFGDNYNREIGFYQIVLSYPKGKGVGTLATMADMVKDYFKEKDLDIKKMMCFFTMTDLRKNLHNEIMEELYKDKRFFQNYIPYLSDVEKMGVNQAPLEIFAASSFAAQCYNNLWKEIKKTCIE